LLTTLLQAHAEAEVIASGGIRSLEDLQRLNRMGCAGAIIGKALYTGAIDLRTAIILLELGYKDLAAYEETRSAFESTRLEAFLDQVEDKASEQLSSVEERIASIEREVAEAARAEAC
ncbi:MAG: HisA/HisF-related TIM barrel protein, partial [Ktedonobacteraceae bacterium]